MSTTAVNDAITSALQNWSQGQQQAAVDTLRPHADADDRSAVLLIAWFLSQMGQPFWNDGLKYVRRAFDLGMPQAGSYYFGQLVGDATFRAQAPDVAKATVAGGWSIDPLPNAPGAWQQGDPATAIQLVHAAATARPYPDAWESLLTEARANFDGLKTAAAEVNETKDNALEAISKSESTIAERETEVQKRSTGLIDLINQITNAQSTSYFDEEATTHGGESRGLWWSGLAVVVATTLAAMVPLAIYYYQRAKGHTPWLDGKELVGVHSAFVIALGALAGVLLARARSRDRLSQRNRDLSVALKTMFAYSEQIVDPAEKQAFVRDMGRTVLEAFLRQDPPTEADRSLMAAIRGQ